MAMLSSVVLYTSANLCVKELSHLGTFQLVFLRSAVSLLLCVCVLARAGLFSPAHSRKAASQLLSAMKPTSASSSATCAPTINSADAFF